MLIIFSEAIQVHIGELGYHPRQSDYKGSTLVAILHYTQQENKQTYESSMLCVGHQLLLPGFLSSGHSGMTSADGTLLPPGLPLTALHRGGD